MTLMGNIFQQGEHRIVILAKAKTIWLKQNFQKTLLEAVQLNMILGFLFFFFFLIFIEIMSIFYPGYCILIKFYCNPL